MSKPLGRDRLGRLVYDGDVGTMKFQEIDGRTDHWMAVRYVDGWRVIKGRDNFLIGCIEEGGKSASFKVDLSASTRMNNYERYFADLGTLEEVIAAWDDCRGFKCSECPFFGWNCTYFPSWLKEVATI